MPNPYADLIPAKPVVSSKGNPYADLVPKDSAATTKISSLPAPSLYSRLRESVPATALLGPTPNEALRENVTKPKLDENGKQIGAKSLGYKPFGDEFEKQGLLFAHPTDLIPKVTGPQVASILPTGTPQPVSDVLAGTERGVAGGAESLISPVVAGTALFGGGLPPLVSRALSATFAPAMVKGAIEHVKGVYAAAKKQDWGAVAEHLTGTGLDAYFGYKSAVHALQPGVVNESPALRNILTEKIQQQYSPEQMRAIYQKVNQGTGTPVENELVRYINTELEHPGEAVREGATITEQKPRNIKPEAFAKWLGMDQIPNVKGVTIGGQAQPKTPQAVPSEPPAQLSPEPSASPTPPDSSPAELPKVAAPVETSELKIAPSTAEKSIAQRLNLKPEGSWLFPGKGHLWTFTLNDPGNETTVHFERGTPFEEIEKQVQSKRQQYAEAHTPEALAETQKALDNFGKPPEVTTPVLPTSGGRSKLFEQAAQEEAKSQPVVDFPKLVSAAVKTPDGKVLQGPNHPAINKELGKPETTREQRNTPDYGFVDSTGKFVTREQATEIAKASGQALQDFEEGHPLHSDQVQSATEPDKTIAETTQEVKPVESEISPKAKELAKKMADKYQADQEADKEHWERLTSEQKAKYTAKPETWHQYFQSLIDAIESKSVPILYDRLHGGNMSTVNAFKELTGINPGKTEGSIKEAVRQFVGPERYDQFLKDRQAAKEVKRAEEAETRAVQAAKNSGETKYNGGETVKSLWDKRIAEGFTELTRYRRGAVQRKGLKNPATGETFALRPFEQPYVEQAIKVLQKPSSPHSPTGATTPTTGPAARETWDKIPEKFEVFTKSTKTKNGSRYYHIKFKGDWYHVRIGDHAQRADSSNILSGASLESNFRDVNSRNSGSGMDYPHEVNIVTPYLVTSDSEALQIIKEQLRKLGPQPRTTAGGHVYGNEEIEDVRLDEELAAQKNTKEEQLAMEQPGEYERRVKDVERNQEFYDAALKRLQSGVTSNGYQITNEGQRAYEKQKFGYEYEQPLAKAKARLAAMENKKPADVLGSGQRVSGSTETSERPKSVLESPTSREATDIPTRSEPKPAESVKSQVIITDAAQRQEIQSTPSIAEALEIAEKSKAAGATQLQIARDLGDAGLSDSDATGIAAQVFEKPAEPETPKTPAEALHQGQTVKLPAGANAVQVRSTGGGYAKALKKDLDTLKDGGPYSSVKALKVQMSGSGTPKWGEAEDVKGKIEIVPPKPEALESKRELTPDQKADKEFQESEKSLSKQDRDRLIAWGTTKDIRRKYWGVNWKRLAELGETDNWKETGYIAPEGQQIDLSGKNEGGPAGTRSFDHREAGGTSGMQEAEAAGFIRLSPESGGMEIVKRPTRLQRHAIEDFVLSNNGNVRFDLHDGLGKKSEDSDYYYDPRHNYSEEFNGAEPSEVIDAIEKFYRGGTTLEITRRPSLTKIGVDRALAERVARMVTAKLGGQLIKLPTQVEAEGMTSRTLDTTEGYVWEGISHVIPENIGLQEGETPEMAVLRVALHEKLGHEGVEIMLQDPAFKKQFDEIVRLVPDKVIATLPPSYLAQYPDWRTNTDQKRSLVKEHIAFESQERGKEDFKKEPWHTRLWNAIKAWLLRTFPKMFIKEGKAQPISDDWVDSILDVSRKMLKDERGSIINPAEVIQKGVEKAVEAIAPVRAAMDEAFDTALKIFAPTTRSKQAGFSGQVIAEKSAQSALDFIRVEHSLADARKLFAKRSNAENIESMQAADTGESTGDPEHDALLKKITSIYEPLKRRVDEIKGGPQQWREYYFPHIWKPRSGKDMTIIQMLSKRPWEGSKAFTKQRVYNDIQEGIEAGLEPVSYNPVDMALLKYKEMQRFITAHDAFDELKSNGLMKYVPAGQRGPDGWTKIDDRLGTVFGPRRGAVKLPPGSNIAGEGFGEGSLVPEDVQVAGLRIMGNYYAPEPVARVINNYLSPGLRSKSGLFRGYIASSNMLNQFQLGLSAFHLGFTSLDAMTSKFALALESAMNGRLVNAAKYMAQNPFAPVSTLLKGRELQLAALADNEWLSPELAAMVDAVVQGGGRFKQEQFYQTQTTQKMLDAFRQGNILSGLFKVPFSVIEQAARPIMEYVVPWQKLGVFADLAKYDLEQLGEDATPEQVRATLQKSWDSVDNRMGQLVYDNLFWNKAAKDLGMASVRSLGWNLGTFREIGGGGFDAGKAAWQTLHGKRPTVTHRIGYTLALPILVGLLGAIYMYLRTGKKPETLKDYYFPKNGGKDAEGRDTRDALPSYMKDLAAYRYQPGQTLANKLHPGLSIIAQMLENQDFYGVKIRNEGDPLVRQAMELAQYAGTQLEPFGVRGAEKLASEGRPLASQALPFVGITPAPGYIVKSQAEQLAAKIMADHIPRGARTKEQADKSMFNASLRNAEKAGDTNAVQNALDTGKINSSTATRIDKESGETYLERLLTHLTPVEALKVFHAATPQEKAQIKDLVERKIDNSHTLTDDQKDAAYKELDELGK